MSGHPPVGAAGAAQVPCSHPVGPAKQQHGIADKVRQFVLLSAEQCADLEHEMVAAEAARRNESATTSTLQHAPQPPQGGTPAKAASVCEVYYDNSSLLLTLRGWWLCEREGSWHLRMPVVNSRGNPEKPLMHYEDIIVPEDILDRVGLVQHADALRQGAAKSVERLLAQAGVLPFARFQTEERIYCREQEGGTVPRRQLTVIVHHVKFDVKYAENRTVSDMLFEQGGAARETLQVAIAEFRVAVPQRAEGTTTAVAEAAARSDLEIAARSLASSLKCRGFKHVDSDSIVCPRLAVYLQRVRPEHWRALCRAGVVPCAPELANDGAPVDSDTDGVKEVEIAGACAHVEEVLE